MKVPNQGDRVRPPAKAVMSATLLRRDTLKWACVDAMNATGIADALRPMDQSTGGTARGVEADAARLIDWYRLLIEVSNEFFSRNRKYE